MRTAVFDVNGAIEGVRADLPVEQIGGLAVDADYFAMFEVPFLYGSAWTRAEDDGKARVIVLGRKKSEKLFGNENPVGKTIHVFDHDFRIVGVRDGWNPVPRYTRLINSSGGALSGEDDVYIPFATATDIELNNNASTSCSDDDRAPGYAGFLKSECTWIQFWFETQDRRGRPAARLPRELRKRAAQAWTAQARGAGAAVRRHGVDALPPGGEQRHAPVRVARLRLPAAVPRQHDRPAARQVLGARGRGRRAARAGRHARRDLPAVPGRGRQSSVLRAASSGWR